MSKFVLRNLNNERRRVEKQLKKIDRQIERIENTRVIAEGTLDLNTLVRFDKSMLDIKGDKVDTTLRFKIKFEEYKKEVTCTLTMLMVYPIRLLKLHLSTPLLVLMFQYLL